MKFFFLAVLLTSQAAWAQIDYKAESIPATLKENAHAVVRRHETTFTVKAPGEATQRVYTLVTVLDNEGDDYATKVVGYDKLSKVTNMEGALYDADGKLIKR